jgi:hypothetical protein
MPIASRTTRSPLRHATTRDPSCTSQAQHPQRPTRQHRSSGCTGAHRGGGRRDDRVHADVTLSAAKTALIRGRAEVHTTRLSAVAALTDEASAKAAEAQQFADVKLQESLFRRQAMVVVLGIILVNVVALYIIRRRIYSESEAS